MLPFNIILIFQNSIVSGILDYTFMFGSSLFHPLRIHTLACWKIPTPLDQDRSGDRQDG